MPSPPAHHKEVARFLKERIGGVAKVSVFRDANEKQRIPIGQFGSGSDIFYSTIGSFDSPKTLPDGNFEFAAVGSLPWLPNAVASSIFWLNERACDDWPLVCEDVVRDNARSTYRHMAYVPSPAKFVLSDGRSIRWLLGVPITDRQIGIDQDGTFRAAQGRHPAWLFANKQAEPSDEPKSRSRRF